MDKIKFTIDDKFFYRLHKLLQTLRSTFNDTFNNLPISVHNREKNHISQT